MMPDRVYVANTSTYYNTLAIEYGGSMEDFRQSAARPDCHNRFSHTDSVVDLHLCIA